MSAPKEIPQMPEWFQAQKSAEAAQEQRSLVLQGGSSDVQAASTIAQELTSAEQLPSYTVPSVEIPYSITILAGILARSANTRVRYDRDRDLRDRHRFPSF